MSQSGSRSASGYSIPEPADETVRIIGHHEKGKKVWKIFNKLFFEKEIKFYVGE